MSFLLIFIFFNKKNKLNNQFEHVLFHIIDFQQSNYKFKNNLQVAKLIIIKYISLDETDSALVDVLANNKQAPFNISP